MLILDSLFLDKTKPHKHSNTSAKGNKKHRARRKREPNILRKNAQPLEETQTSVLHFQMQKATTRTTTVTTTTTGTMDNCSETFFTFIHSAVTTKKGAENPEANQMQQQKKAHTNSI